MSKIKSLIKIAETILIWEFFTIPPVKMSLGKFKSVTIDESISSAVSKLIERDLHHESSNIYIFLSFQYFDNYRSQLDCANEIMAKTPDIVDFQIQNANNPITFWKLRKKNIFIIDNYNSFRKIYTQITDKLFFLYGYYLIIIPERIKNSEKILKLIFDDCWRIFITNVNIVYQTNQGSEVKIYTYFPYTSTHCRNTDPFIYNTFVNGSFSKNLSTFPAKFKNFHSCPLRAVVFDNNPMVYFKKFANGTYLFDGIDATVVGIFAAKLNFTPEIIEAPPPELRGTVFKNGTSTGLFKMVVDKIGDFTICGHGADYNRYQVLAKSKSYFFTEMVYAIPPKNTYSSFEKLFFPYTAEVWIVVGLMFILASFIKLLLIPCNKKLNHFLFEDKNGSLLLSMVDIFLGGSTVFTTKRDFLRTAFIVWVMSSLVLRTSYQGSLFGFMQRRDAKKLNSNIVELIEDGYTLYISKAIVELVAYIPGIKNRYTFTEEPVGIFNKMLDDPNFKAILIIPKLSIAHFNSLNYRKGLIGILPDRLQWYPYTLYFQKNSYLKTAFDEIILRTNDRGVTGNLYSKYINEVSESRAGGKGLSKALTINDLEGCFEMFMLLICLACVVFILEICFTKMQNLNCVKIHKILNILSVFKNKK